MSPEDEEVARLEREFEAASKAVKDAKSAALNVWPPSQLTMTKYLEDTTKTALESAKKQADLSMVKKRIAELEAKNPELGQKSSLTEGSMKWKVDVEKIGEEIIFSPYTHIGGASFRLGCRRFKDKSGEKQLEMSLYCNDGVTQKTFAVKAFYDVEMENSRRATEFNFYWPQLFVAGANSWEEAREWDEVIDPENGFVQNGCFTFLAEIKVLWCRKNGVVDFSSADSHLSDVTLFVGGKVFHVNRMYIAQYSGYFATLFCSDFAEKDKKEIVLKDVDPKEFEDMLGVIYPQKNEVTDETVEGLLRMADFFDIHAVRVACTDFLLNSFNIYRPEALTISEKFGLVDLQHSIIEMKLENASIMRDFIGREDFDKLSDALQRAILRKFYSICMEDRPFLR